MPGPEVRVQRSTGIGDEGPRSFMLVSVERRPIAARVTRVGTGGHAKTRNPSSSNHQLARGIFSGLESVADRAGPSHRSRTAGRSKAVTRCRPRPRCPVRRHPAAPLLSDLPLRAIPSSALSAHRRPTATSVPLSASGPTSLPAIRTRATPPRPCLLRHAPTAPKSTA